MTHDNLYVHTNHFPPEIHVFSILQPNKKMKTLSEKEDDKIVINLRVVFAGMFDGVSGGLDGMTGGQ